MARAQRFDLHRLDGPEVLPSGALRVPARVAKVGVLRYQDADGNTWGELVPESTLFAADSMATLRAAACTDLHPAKPVTPLTRKGLQVGHVGDVVTRDGDYLAATVYVTDGDAIALVQSGQRRDVSCGYECELDETPGSYNGVPYDRVQRDRVYNHLGIGPEGWGRAGTDVSLKMDGAGEPSALSGLAKGAAVARLDSGDVHAVQLPPQGAQKTSADSQTTGSAAPTTAPEKGTRSAMAQPKTNVKKDGDEPNPMDPKKDEPKKDMEGGDEMVPKKDADAMAAQSAAKLAAMEALIAQLTKEIAELKSSMAAPVTEENVPEMVADSIVAKRLAKLDAAREGARLIAPAAKLDGLMIARKIHEAAIAVALPTLKLDGLSDDGVNGVFVGQVEAAKKAGEKRQDGKGQDSRQDGRTVRNDALGAAHRVIAEPGEKPADSVEDAIRKMHQDSCDDWKRATPALRVATTIQAD